MKDCAFQFATNSRTVKVDTGLITRADAEELWQKHLPEFITAMEYGNDPEMALWIDMSDGDNYHNAVSHYQSGDMIVRDGKLYKLVACR